MSYSSTWYQVGATINTKKAKELSRSQILEVSPSSGERVLRVKRTRGSPECDFYASRECALLECAALECAFKKYFPFVRLRLKPGEYDIIKAATQPQR